MSLQGNIRISFNDIVILTEIGENWSADDGGDVFHAPHDAAERHGEVYHIQTGFEEMIDLSG